MSYHQFASTGPKKSGGASTAAQKLRQKMKESCAKKLARQKQQLDAKWKAKLDALKVKLQAEKNNVKAAKREAKEKENKKKLKEEHAKEVRHYKRKHKQGYPWAAIPIEYRW
jgi:hypothetical protein